MWCRVSARCGFLASGGIANPQPTNRVTPPFIDRRAGHHNLSAMRSAETLPARTSGELRFRPPTLASVSCEVP
jgi:hypothetical protein